MKILKILGLVIPGAAAIYYGLFFLLVGGMD